MKAKIIFISALATIVMLGGAATSSIVRAQASVTLVHVHGLGFSADGQQLLIPSHEGLAIYSAGRWSKAAGPQHDYMGFAATKQRLYSSGHPAPESGLQNPFGLIRSDDNGKTWIKLGLEGQSDFHLMAVGPRSGRHVGPETWDAPAIVDELRDAIAPSRQTAK